MNRKELYDRLMCIFFPRRCKYCGEVIEPSEALCEHCKSHLPGIVKPVCLYCGKAKEDCTCKQKKSYYDSIVAPFYYSGAIVKAVSRLKFQSKPYLSEGYAQDMADCLKELTPDKKYDLICYVPFYKKDIKRRPFNQSRELALHLSEILGVELSDALIRLYPTGIQHRLSASKRGGNVFGAFGVGNTDEVNGKRILLVDDIKTTGATFNECAKMLKIYSAASVDCVAFAIGKGKQNVDSKG